MTDVANLAANRALWAIVNEQFAGPAGAELWARDEPTWGIVGTPESDLRVLPRLGGRNGTVADLNVIEVGCGTAHVSAWLARRGARVIAIDLSEAQLGTARAAQREHGARFPLIQADAGALPLADASADAVISEHGAPAWCDPWAWIPEVARVLRPGGRLIFLTNSPLSAMCVPADGGPAGDRLLRGPADLRTVRWPGGGVEHHPSHGEWVRVLTANGLVVDELAELHAPPAGPSGGWASYGIVESEWARRWPAEDLWVAHRSSGVAPWGPVPHDGASAPEEA